MKKVSQMNIVDREPLHKVVPLNTPFVFYFEPSGYCNLKCNFCCQRGRGGAEGLKKAIMPFSLAKKVVDDICDFPDKAKMIRICGFGEPLVNPEFVEIIEYMHEKLVQTRIVLVTNGILLTPELSENIVKYIDHIIISIEGINQEQYAEFSNVQIDYDRFYSGLKYLYECSKNEKCTICLKIHGDAVKEKTQLDQFYKMFGDMCDEITVENLVNLFPEVNIHEYQNAKFRYDNSEYIEKKVCPQMFKSLQINADGVVIPCCVDWKRGLCLGNANDKSLLDIWNGKELHELRNKHLGLLKGKIEPCKYCTMNDTSEVDYLDDSIEEIKERMGIN